MRRRWKKGKASPSAESNAFPGIKVRDKQSLLAMKQTSAPATETSESGHESTESSMVRDSDGVPSFGNVGPSLQRASAGLGASTEDYSFDSVSGGDLPQMDLLPRPAGGRHSRIGVACRLRLGKWKPTSRFDSKKRYSLGFISFDEDADFYYQFEKGDKHRVELSSCAFEKVMETSFAIIGGPGCGTAPGPGQEVFVVFESALVASGWRERVEPLCKLALADIMPWLTSGADTRSRRRSILHPRRLIKSMIAKKDSSISSSPKSVSPIQAAARAAAARASQRKDTKAEAVPLEQLRAMAASEAPAAVAAARRAQEDARKDPMRASFERAESLMAELLQNVCQLRSLGLQDDNADRSTKETAYYSMCKQALDNGMALMKHVKQLKDPKKRSDYYGLTARQLVTEILVRIRKLIWCTGQAVFNPLNYLSEQRVESASRDVTGSMLSLSHLLTSWLCVMADSAESAELVDALRSAQRSVVVLSEAAVVVRSGANGAVAADAVPYDRLCKDLAIALAPLLEYAHSNVMKGMFTDVFNSSQKLITLGWAVMHGSGVSNTTARHRLIRAAGGVRAVPLSQFMDDVRLLSLNLVGFMKEHKDVVSTVHRKSTLMAELYRARRKSMSRGEGSLAASLRPVKKKTKAPAPLSPRETTTRKAFLSQLAQAYSSLGKQVPEGVAMDNEEPGDANDGDDDAAAKPRPKAAATPSPGRARKSGQKRAKSRVDPSGATCPTCNKPRILGAHHCTKCGTSLDDVPEVQPETAPHTVDDLLERISKHPQAPPNVADVFREHDLTMILLRVASPTDLVELGIPLPVGREIERLLALPRSDSAPSSKGASAATSSASSPTLAPKKASPDAGAKAPSGAASPTVKSPANRRRQSTRRRRRRPTLRGATMHCTSCERDLKPGAKFCSRCGPSATLVPSTSNPPEVAAAPAAAPTPQASGSSPAAPTATSARTCSKCGEPSNAPQCRACGYVKVPGASAAAPHESPAPATGDDGAASPSPAAEEPEFVCPQCQAPISATATQCDACGFGGPDEAAAQPSAAEEETHVMLVCASCGDFGSPSEDEPCVACGEGPVMAIMVDASGMPIPPPEEEEEAAAVPAPPVATGGGADDGTHYLLVCASCGDMNNTSDEAPCDACGQGPVTAVLVDASGMPVMMEEAGVEPSGAADDGSGGAGECSGNCKCPNCDELVPRDAVECPNCEYPEPHLHEVAVMDTDSAPDVVLRESRLMCPRCGESLAPEAMSCTACGFGGDGDAADAGGTIDCLMCDKSIPMDALVCPHCEARQDEFPCVQCGHPVSATASACDACGFGGDGAGGAVAGGDARRAAASRSDALSTCSNCSRPLLPDDLFCTGCGTMRDGTGMLQTGYECSECGQPVAADATSCGACGFGGEDADVADFACINCGKAVEADATSCSHCGFGGDAGAEDEGEAQAFECANCGESVSEDADACPKCGFAGFPPEGGQAPGAEEDGEDMGALQAIEYEGGVSAAASAEAVKGDALTKALDLSRAEAETALLDALLSAVEWHSLKKPPVIGMWRSHALFGSMVLGNDPATRLSRRVSECMAPLAITTHHLLIDANLALLKRQGFSRSRFNSGCATLWNALRQCMLLCGQGLNGSGPVLKVLESTGSAFRSSEVPRGKVMTEVADAAAGSAASEVVATLRRRVVCWCNQLRLAVVQLLQHASAMESMDTLAPRMWLQMGCFMTAVSHSLQELLDTVETCRSILIYPVAAQERQELDPEDVSHRGLSAGVLEAVRQLAHLTRPPKDTHVWQQNRQKHKLYVQDHGEAVAARMRQADGAHAQWGSETVWMAANKGGHLVGRAPNGVQQIRAANLNNLILELATQSVHCDYVTATVLYTYRSFTDARGLWTKLLQCYEFPESVTKGDREATKLRLMMVIRTWIDMEYREFDDKLWEEICTFVTEQIAQDPDVPNSDWLSQKVEKLTDARKQGDRDELNVPNLRLEVPSMTVSPFDMVAQYSNGEIARQMTLIDWEWFSRIRSVEMLNKSWSDPAREHGAPNVLGLIHRAHVISYWVATCIIWPETVPKRVVIVLKFIRIAERLRRLNNYNGLMAVLAGLAQSAVQRMSKTWDRLKKHHKMDLERLSDLRRVMKPRSYWTALHASIRPALPYVGAYLARITLVSDAQPETVDGLINVQRLEGIQAALEEVQLFQQLPYGIPRSEPLSSLLLQMPHLQQTELFQLSLAREPIDVKVKRKQ